MAFDENNKYFIAVIQDCAKHLSQEELDQLQGLINKVEILSKKPDEYEIISRNKTPKLFNLIQEIKGMLYAKN